MNLHDFLGPVDLEAEDRWQAINELVDLLVANDKVKPEHRDAVAESICRMERSTSTGIGSGIGMPHASTEVVTMPVGAIGRSRKGIQFDALDGKPVHVVALFLVPKGNTQKNVNTLAHLARQLHKFNRKFDEQP